MNQTLEIQNNQIIFNRAKKVMRKHFGELREVDIKNLRDVFLKRTWKIEARQLKEMRTELGLKILDVAKDLKLKEAQILKLENAKDFNKRDVTAQFLMNFYNLRLN
jgi:hypothetical protein